MNTKFTIGITVFSVVFSWFPSITLGNQPQTQTQNQPDIAALFDRAAAKHKRELYDLSSSRGASLIKLPNASSERVARVLKKRTNSYSREAAYLKNTAVLFYSYEKATMQTWLVDEHGIQAYNKQKISEQQINQAITNLRDSLNVDSLKLNRSPRRKGTRISPIPQKAKLPVNRSVANITEILLPQAIANKLIPVKHLIIVPVLGLGTVPYPMLKPFKDDSLLIDKMSISIAPSLFDVGAHVSPWNAKSAFSSPLIVGNPELPTSDEWDIPPLPGAEKEAQVVAKIMNVFPLTGKEATKEAIAAKAQNSTILYFATHAVASDVNPLLGGFLMFSAKRLEQGWWTAKEVQQARLRDTQIAILSACQTGLGKVHDAGIIGLARAFQIAGVPRVVMSLWSVNDDATNELMQAFVKHLENDIPAEALRKAMLDVKKKRTAPSQWASFVLFGTPR
jgi:CHAT domain-containing protein